MTFLFAELLDSAKAKSDDFEAIAATVEEFFQKLDAKTANVGQADKTRALNIKKRLTAGIALLASNIVLHGDQYSVAAQYLQHWNILVGNLDAAKLSVQELEIVTKSLTSLKVEQGGTSVTQFGNNAQGAGRDHVTNYRGSPEGEVEDDKLKRKKFGFI